MSIFSKVPGSASIPAPQASLPTPSVMAPLDPLTEDDIKKALPSHLRASVTQSLVDALNGITSDPIVAQDIRNNFVGYCAILKEGKFKTEDYLHAVAYVSYKLMGDSNQDAYAKTFPQRYAALTGRGASSKDIAAYVSAFHKGKLVNLIMEQSLVPSWVLNQDLYQKAINVQANLMLNAKSEKVQTDAANSLLTHLKKPEAIKGTLSLDVSESAGMKEMRDLLTQLASDQRQRIQNGELKTIDVAGSRLISREDVTDV
jgi:hypothetical protein